MKIVKVSDFIKIKYRTFWEETNISKNTFSPKDELMTIEKKVIWAAYKIGMLDPSIIRKTLELAGETSKYHIAGNDSIQDSIKGLASSYKRQPAVRLLYGIGNFGDSASSDGAAARYTSIKGTPLLTSIIKDLPFVPMVINSTGDEQPEYIPTPFPMALINGLSQIGAGHSAYYDERNAREIVNWIDCLIHNKNCEIPKPISTTGCIVYKKANGYTYYDAVIIHEKNNDIITALPPKINANIVINKLRKKFPKSYANKIIDGSGKGHPTWIIVPKGLIKDADMTKYSLRTARKEAYYIWDDQTNTMKMSNLNDIALAWFKTRKQIVEKRIKNQINNLNINIHRINLIKQYVDEHMSTWSYEKIKERLGEEDCEIVLSSPERVFLPENIEKNEIRKKSLEDKIDSYNHDLLNIDDVIIKEAYDIIDKQEKYFN
jgi:DNA gyrase/topoisomerase IV subunit A